MRSSWEGNTVAGVKMDGERKGIHLDKVEFFVIVTINIAFWLCFCFVLWKKWHSISIYPRIWAVGILRTQAHVRKTTSLPATSAILKPVWITR